MLGKVFSIEEFATFDGPGIRTTVFLKGCPLKCTWCHNPEGQSFQTEYIRSPNGCIGCKACERAGTKKDGKVVLTADSIAVCPRNLVRQCGEDYTAEALAKKLLKNEEFMRSSGGGVTFSGGEPLSHAEFIIECISKLNGLSTALQTSGFSSGETFERVLNAVDYVLYDLKIIDEERHKKYCGVSNRSILENYATLARSGKKFVTRIPLIPSVTDTDENLEAIAKFMQKNGVNYVELLPYNRFAGSKYASVLREYVVDFDESQEVNKGEKIFEKYNINYKIM
ncbi:MAG: glycyl-radical enzyme activating protein [Clostridiales bacterium]|nr:glycyl-radical enzyme activating protein [Clostridiales bacterium]